MQHLCHLLIQIMTKRNVEETMIDLSGIRAVLLDMDGVMYVGDSPLPGVQDFLDYLDATDRKWLCVTNNSTKTPELFVEKLQRMNVRARPENVLGSAQATAEWLAQRVPLTNGSRPKTIMVGETGLHSALLVQKFELVEDPFMAEYAVVGINFKLTYDMVAKATLAIRNGAQFIGTNPDTSFPSEEGQIPGTGAVIALVEAATGVKPTVIGKPNAGMYELAMARLGVTPQETLMVGDRYETDIVGAIPLGMTTAAVLTGINSRTEFESAEAPPHLIVDDLPTLERVFRASNSSSAKSA